MKFKIIPDEPAFRTAAEKCQIDRNSQKYVRKSLNAALGPILKVSMIERNKNEFQNF